MTFLNVLGDYFISREKSGHVLQKKDALLSNATHMRPVFPLSRKTRNFRHFLWTPTDKNYENRHLQIWTQFLSLQKISQNKISLLFQKCAGHIFTI